MTKPHWHHIPRHCVHLCFSHSQYESFADGEQQKNRRSSIHQVCLNHHRSTNNASDKHKQHTIGRTEASLNDHNKATSLCEPLQFSQIEEPSKRSEDVSFHSPFTSSTTQCPRGLARIFFFFFSFLLHHKLVVS